MYLRPVLSMGEGLYKINIQCFVIHENKTDWEVYTDSSCSDHALIWCKPESVLRIEANIIMLAIPWGQDDRCFCHEDTADHYLSVPWSELFHPPQEILFPHNSQKALLLIDYERVCKEEKNYNYTLNFISAWTCTLVCISLLQNIKAHACTCKDYCFWSILLNIVMFDLMYEKSSILTVELTVPLLERSC